MAQQDIAPTDNGADSLVKIEANFTELYGNVEDLQDGTQLHALTDKTTPADADEIGLIDSEDSNVLKKLTWANLHRGIGSGWIPVAVSWSYASADAPTFTITVPSGAASLYSPGMRIKLTQTTVKYFIITAVADTVLTVYGGTDYILTSDAISEISYSTQKAPFGFPLSPTKWSLSSYSVSGSQNTPTANTMYNLGGSLVLPIGAWELEYNATPGIYSNLTSAFTVNAGLSTTNSTFSDNDLVATNTVGGRYGSAASELRFYGSAMSKKFIDLSEKATYYLNLQTTTASISVITMTDGNIIAKCAYL